MTHDHHLEQDFSRTVGNYFGVLLYWPDVQRLTPLHKTPRLAEFFRWVANKALSIGYSINTRQALREVKRDGCERPKW